MISSNRIIALIFIALFCSIKCRAASEELDREYYDGLVAYNKGSFDDAQAILESVTLKTDEFPMAFFVLAKAIRKGSSPDRYREIELFDKTYKLSRSERTKMNARIMASYSLRGLDDARSLEYANEALKLSKSLDPNGKHEDARAAVARAIYGIGRAKKIEGKLDEAEEKFRESIKVHQGIVEAYNALASLLLERQEKAEKMGTRVDSSICREIGRLLARVEFLNKNYELLTANKKRLGDICPETIK